MSHKSALIITSIAEPNSNLKKWASECLSRRTDFIVIGDEKSPIDFELQNCDFWSLEKQRTTGFKYAEICPANHYTRKNIGYLIALRRGCSIILETDDDNSPLEIFWKQRDPALLVKVAENAGWVNVFKYFSDCKIWPRGFPLDLVNVSPPEFEDLPIRKTLCPIHNGLADNNPDVDAIYRMMNPTPHYFSHNSPVALGQGSWCPFNSQNTAWFREAFILMYLPATCSFRMTDIWRSFIAQRIAWENNWGILFHHPTVYQKRNKHHLMSDFQEEIPGYLNNRKMAQILENLPLKAGKENIATNLLICYEKLIAESFFDEYEKKLLNAWLDDIKDIGTV